jgi:hypothetical protein
MTLLNIWNLINVQCDNNLNFIQRIHLRYTRGFKTVPIICKFFHIYQNVTVFVAIAFFWFWMWIYTYCRMLFFVKGSVAWCHSFCLFNKFYSAYSTLILSQSHISTFIRHHLLRFLSISSSLVSSVGKTSVGWRAENRTRPALRQAQALPAELRRTLLSYAAPYWAMPHPYWPTPHPTELRRTLLSYAAPVFLRRINNSNPVIFTHKCRREAGLGGMRPLIYPDVGPALMKPRY